MQSEVSMILEEKKSYIEVQDDNSVLESKNITSYQRSYGYKHKLVITAEKQYCELDKSFKV